MPREMNDSPMEENGLRKKQNDKLERMAALGRWPITDEQKQKSVNRLVKNIESGSDRDSNIAAKVLLGMEAQNQADDHHADPQPTAVVHEHNHTITTESRRLLVARAAERLGIGGFTVEGIAESAGADSQRTVESPAVESEHRGDADPSDGAAE